MMREEMGKAHTRTLVGRRGLDNPNVDVGMRVVGGRVANVVGIRAYFVVWQAAGFWARSGLM